MEQEWLIENTYAYTQSYDKVLKYFVLISLNLCFILPVGLHLGGAAVKLVKKSLFTFH